MTKIPKPTLKPKTRPGLAFLRHFWTAVLPFAATLLAEYIGSNTGLVEDFPKMEVLWPYLVTISASLHAWARAREQKKEEAGLG
jgi:hypothetical protein